jgi:hypothetical protein
MKKNCTKCGLPKDLEEFHVSSSARDGRKPDCKVCAGARQKKYSDTHKEQIKAYKERYYADPVNKENKRINDKRWATENVERKKKMDKDYAAKNKEKIRKKQKEWNSIPENKEWVNAYKQNKRLTDINFRLACNLRNRIRKLLKTGRPGSAVRDIGCSLDDFKLYIEAKFQPGMTWNNYGEWHLDHIRPLCSFNLENREEFLEACNYKNIQPLWKLDNLTKSDKLPEDYLATPK